MSMSSDPPPWRVWRGAEQTGGSPPRAAEAQEATGGLRVGTWNMSHWSIPKVDICAGLGLDVLALQETHLAPVPLESAHTTARVRGLRLHHGRPAVPTPGGTWGRACGVGFLAVEAVALQAVLPKGAAWRRLHAIRRVHAVRLAPSTGLPLGLLLISVYAPQQSRALETERLQFAAAFLDFVHSLDMQVPTLLLGDFNGTTCPSRDYMSGGAGRLACPLLMRLLGPGGPLVDVQVALLGDAALDWTYRNVDSNGRMSGSRIDLVLANRAALSLVQEVKVVTEVRDGGHSPVVVSLCAPVVRLGWRRPRPQLPELLQSSSVELRDSEEWKTLLERWAASSEVQVVLADTSSMPLDELSDVLLTSLQTLVRLAGGWGQRPAARRPAYESNEVRRLRRCLTLLCRLEGALQRCPTAPGCRPWQWEQWLAELQCAGLPMPEGSVSTLQTAVRVALHDGRLRLDRCLQQMRTERQARWREALPRLWRERPAVIYGWLRGESAAWGATPILDSAGHQCATVESVDEAVQQFWVSSVLRRHAGVDGAARWNVLLQSEFGAHIPTVPWRQSDWTAGRVKQALASMREGAAPGQLGIPVAIWKSLPDAWLASLARMFQLVEAEGRWPTAWTHAYITMIPKASGGSRPEDQRPITVLDLPYRVWAKAVVQEWKPTLQTAYLGDAALGFRAQSGTTHVAQLLQDLIFLQARRGAELWLASFDIRKCYDMLPWWALFGIARRAGVPESTVRAFETFYHQLQRRFRYGQVDGAAWHAANGAAQGCPASPDLLNLLLEAFHCWARAEGLGVRVGPAVIPSVSYADDVALVAQNQAEMEVLATAYLRWCALLDLEVTKVQLWWSGRGVRRLRVEGLEAETQPLFRIVGVVLGMSEITAAAAQAGQRLPKAIATAQRLQALDVPAALAAHLWKTTVLPQALYGCEVRNLTTTLLQPLTSLGKTMLAAKYPLKLNNWRAPEVLMGPPLGDSALRDPVWEMRIRQLCWLQLVANLPGLVGVVHREVAYLDGAWEEPTAALRTALQAVGWRAVRNESCLRSVDWPQLTPEAAYPGDIYMLPVDDFPVADAVFTDGSVAAAGGAAAVQPDTGVVLQLRLPQPRSSTHCELVALALALGLETPQVVTDSLTSLELLSRWPFYSAARILRCADRVEVRRVLHLAAGLVLAPRLEKVKAHDDSALEMGHPKAVGNDRADYFAKRAAWDVGIPQLDVPLSEFEDPVLLLNGSEDVIQDVSHALQTVDWRDRGSLPRRARPMLDMLYPAGLDIDWGCSAGIFGRPTTAQTTFVHPVLPAVVKWMARLRAGCLAARERLFRRKMVASAACPCCASPTEDEEHILFGCPATGTADWLVLLCEAWAKAAAESEVVVAEPPEVWLQDHRWQLVSALIPSTISEEVHLAPADRARFCRRLHVQLALETAERLRRRQAMIATAVGSDGVQDCEPAAEGTNTSTWVSGLPRRCALATERQLSPRSLRDLEVQRRADSIAAEPPSLPSSSSSSGDALPVPPSPPAPLLGRQRARWLRQRLVQLLQEDTELCPVVAGSTAETLLALFEHVTSELFTDSPSATLTSRIRSFAKVLGNLTREALLRPPLQSVERNMYRVWNRAPRVRMDLDRWRQEERRRDAAGPSVLRVRQAMAGVDAELASWMRDHRYLVPTAVEQGESSMALLLLWEVDHGRPFPAGVAGESVAATLASFSRRLRTRVGQDDELSAWLQVREMQFPLAPGLPASHQLRWSVQVQRPELGEATGWYDEFVARWRTYLASLLPASQRAPPAAEAPEGRPRKRQRAARPRADAVEASMNVAVTVPVQGARDGAAVQPAGCRQRVRARSPTTEPGPDTKRPRMDLRSWLQPRGKEDTSPSATASCSNAGPAVSSGHGRATSGDPT